MTQEGKSDIPTLSFHFIGGYLKEIQIAVDLALCEGESMSAWAEALLGPEHLLGQLPVAVFAIQSLRS